MALSNGDYNALWKKWKALTFPFVIQLAGLIMGAWGTEKFFWMVYRNIFLLSDTGMLRCISWIMAIIVSMLPSLIVQLEIWQLEKEEKLFRKIYVNRVIRNFTRIGSAILLALSLLFCSIFAQLQGIDGLLIALKICAGMAGILVSMIGAGMFADKTLDWGW
jgi:hypothetical protein